MSKEDFYEVFCGLWHVILTSLHQCPLRKHGRFGEWQVLWMAELSVLHGGDERCG